METTLPNIKPIGTVTIPCLVLEKNRIQFTDYDDEIVLGKVLDVPCRNTDRDSWGDVWAVPVRDSGIFTSLCFIPKVGVYETTPPTYDSKTAFRIWDKITEELEWYILGSRTDFFNSCSSCCGASYTPMPGVNSDGSRNFTWRVAPTVQLGNLVNNNDECISYWGIPTQTSGLNYFPYGSFNDIAFPNAPSTGFSDIPTMLSWLNSNASSVGSPYETLVWSTYTSPDSGITSLVATGGEDGDIIGLSVALVSAT